MKWMNEYILEMLDIYKEFPGVHALAGVNLRIRPGTVHALVGENGAGKSTLMKCLMAIYGLTSGKIIYQGKETVFRNISDALRCGLSMIHQELNPVLERTVCENIWLGREPRKGFIIDHKKMKKDTVELLKELGINHIDPCALIKNLSVAQMQLVEIAKAVSYDAKIVIMDEPTSSLTTSEVEQLFRIIRQLKEKGTAVIYISHKMDEISQICDEVTVLRDGQFIATDKIENMDINQIISLMVGRKIDEMFPKVDCPIGDTILKVENLSSGKAVKNVSFELHRGEILGFAGLVGAGRTEVMEAIFGIRAMTGGKIFKNGTEIHIKNPADAIKNNIVFLTEDRRLSGIIGIRSVMENIILSSLKHYVRRSSMLDYRKIEKECKEYIEKLNIKTPELDTQIQYLSGGNQQKVLVARCLLTDPDILIIDEPTRGIDVGAKAEIQSLISFLAGQGKAIIMVSSELPEVIGMSDRVVVMHEGVMTGTIDRKDLSQETIMKYAIGALTA